MVGERNSGFKDFEAAIERNRLLKERGLLKNEVKIDNTQNDPEKTVRDVLELIR